MEYTGFNDIRKQRILNAFKKGVTGEPIGAKKTWGGVEYQKTTKGWVPVGKGLVSNKKIENSKPAAGGGAKVDKGSVITNKKEGTSGRVSAIDETHAHIEWTDKVGEKKTSKVPHDHLHEKIQAGEYNHHIPAKNAKEGSGAADAERISDPANITDTDTAFEQLDNYFKGDEEAERTIKFLKGAIGKDSRIRIDTKMEFDDDRILGLSYPDGRIGVNVDSPLMRDKENAYRTLMHEMVHAVTREKMKTSEVLQDEFNNILGEVRKHLGITDDDNLAKVLYAQGDLSEDKYGVSDQYEMVAEVFTNPKFTELLKSIPYKKSDLLHRVMTAIFSAFGGTAKKVKDAKSDLKGVDNMADYLVGLTEKVFKPEPKKDQKKKKDAGKVLPKMAVGGDGKLSDKDSDVHMPAEMKGIEAGHIIDCQNGQKAKVLEIKGGKVTYQIDGSKGEKKVSLVDVAKYIQSGWWKTSKGEEIKKSMDTNELEKAKVAAPLGTIKKMGERFYIKKVDGWKYHASGNSTAVAHTPVVSRPATVKPVPTEVGSHTETGGTPQDDNPKVNINERFSACARQTKAVIKGAAKCQILYGTGGVGKTYGVTHLLDAAGMKPFDEDVHTAANTVAGEDSESEDEPEEKSEKNSEKSQDYDYIKITGYMSTPELYKAMYEHNGKLLLFDDCDKVLRDGNSVNLFKGALDSSGDGTISYGTKTGVKDEEGNKLPKRFKFTGKAIFISNLASHEVPQPIKSRALRADLSMTPEQTIDRLKFIAKNKEGKYQNLKFQGVGNYSHKDMESIIDFLDKHKHNTSDLNVRTVGSMLAIKKIADEEGHDWKKDAEHMIFSKGQEIDIYNGGLQKAQAVRLMKSYGYDSSLTLEKGGVTSLEYRNPDVPEVEDKESREKAMTTGNTPGAEYVEKSLSSAFEVLGLN